MVTSLKDPLILRVLSYLPDQSVRAIGLTCHQMAVIARKEFKRRSDELQSLLSPYTLTRKFNVEEATQSRTFLLGEAHGLHIADKSRIIFHLSNRAQVILLLEGVSSMEKREDFFEKNWNCPSILTPDDIAMLEPIKGVPYVRKNLIGYGWDGQLSSKEARSNHEKAIQEITESICGLFSSLSNLMDSLDSNAWLFLNQAIPIDDQADTVCKIKMYDRLVRHIRLCFLEPIIEHPDHEAFFASWESNKCEAEKILDQLESDEDLENLFEVNNLFKQAHEFLTLLPVTLLDEGVDYSCTKEKVYDLAKEEKRPFRERVKAAIQHLSLRMIRMRRNTEPSLAAIEKFVEEWSVLYGKWCRLNRIKPEEFNFQTRTTAMVTTLRNIREKKIEAAGKFVVVMAGASHLKNIVKSHYFDLTPLYEELAHHKAAILTHSAIIKARL